VNPVESIDDILAEVKAEYLQPTQPSEVKKLLFNSELLLPSPSVAATNVTQGGFHQLATSPEQSLLEQVKSEFAEQAKAEQLERQQQLQAEQLRQAQQLEQQRQAIAQTAKDWLKQLDPLSEEGLWFEEFAYAYPTKLAAAIDYLIALTPTHP
jgi:hypothetical protein